MANGLDTRGVADGFMKGYSFMQGIEDKKDSKSRQERLDQENRDYRAQSQQNWETTRTDNLAAREQSQANTDRAFGLNMQQFNQTKEHNQWSRDRTDSQDDIAEQERLHKQNLEIIQRGYQLAAEGVPFSDEFYRVVESSPRYSQLNPTNLLSPEMGAAIEQGKAVMNPEQPAQMNDPESIAAMNVLYGPDINSDREGNPLEGNRKLVSMYPGKQEGTVVGAVELEDGKRAPITTKRGTEKDGDNTVLQQPVGAMIQKLSAADQMRQFLLSETGQKAVKKRAQALKLIPKDKLPEYQMVKSQQYDEFGTKTGESPVGVFDKTTGKYRKLNTTEASSPTKPMSGLPDASAHKGRTVRDTETGERLRSDGNNWIPVK
jgi:hypothetical protein